MVPLRPLLVIGTRPEAIKLAPLVRVCQAQSDRFAPLVCFTGQHDELLEHTAEYFGLRPDVDLRLMTPDQTPARFAGRCLSALDGVLREHGPDCVVGQGDTASAWAAATAAFYRRLPFVHVEAGLRTGDMTSPWPEEFHRRAIGLTAALHCAPTKKTAERLLAEGIPAAVVHMTGNTVVDALLWTLERERNNPDHIHRFSSLASGQTVLITCHRRESFGQPLRDICQAIATLADRWPETRFIFPVHPNPNVAGPVRAALSDRANVTLLPPLAHPEFVWLLDRATLVLTDSGGVQEEAPSLGVPVLVLREHTERAEAIDAGCAELVGVDPTRIVERASAVLAAARPRAGSPPFPNPFGDGLAAERIADLMAEHFARSKSTHRV